MLGSLFPQLRTDSQGSRGGPRPFLKWAGGKGQLLRDLLSRLERVAWRGTYHEVFVGGGALFFELARFGRLPGAVVLTDANPNLIETYVAVRDEPLRLIELLREHEARNSSEHYYTTRGSTPETATARAARVIYLNKTCFNGLYRENSKGKFNVPFGRYANPTICDAANLTAGSDALQGVSLQVSEFESVASRARPGDFVYLDPPYVPLSATSSFTSYAKGGFGVDHQRRLAQLYRDLSLRGVAAMLSNSMTPIVRELYADFEVEAVLANRAVNSKADRRGKIEEALVNNFKFVGVPGP